VHTGPSSKSCRSALHRHNQNCFFLDANHKTTHGTGPQGLLHRGDTDDRETPLAIYIHMIFYIYILNIYRIWKTGHITYIDNMETPLACRSALQSSVWMHDTATSSRSSDLDLSRSASSTKPFSWFEI
jgi:hypothetical protein